MHKRGAAVTAAVAAAAACAVVLWRLRRRSACAASLDVDQRRAAVRKAYEATVTGSAGCCKSTTSVSSDPLRPLPCRAR